MDTLLSIQAIFVYTFTLSLFLGYLIIPRILVISLKMHLYDEPNVRKVHRGFICRLGGFSFAPSVIIASLLAVCFGMNVQNQHILSEFYIYSFHILILICGLIFLFLIGLYDDLIGANYKQKFIFQIIVSSLFPLSGVYINNLDGILGIYELTPWIGIPLTVTIMVMIINAFNFIDGIDGLAAGLSFISMIVILGLCIWWDYYILGIIAAAALGVIVPFFIYNVFGKKEGKRKKIFMGDTGSLTLGYISSFFIIIFSSQNDLFTNNGNYYDYVIVAFSTIIVPVFDLIRVAFSRILKGVSPFKPDMNHLHHKLIKLGFSMRMAMLLIIALSCLFVVISIVLAPLISINFILIIDILIWIILSVTIHYFAEKHKR